MHDSGAFDPTMLGLTRVDMWGLNDYPASFFASLCAANNVRMGRRS